MRTVVLSRQGAKQQGRHGLWRLRSWAMDRAHADKARRVAAYKRDMAQARRRYAVLRRQVAARLEAGFVTPYDPDMQLALVRQTGRKIGVVILGAHYAWERALESDSPVWKFLPEVVRLTIIDSNPGAALARHAEAGLVSLVIPLLEGHIRFCDASHPGFFPNPAAMEILADKLLFSRYMEESAPDHAPVSYTDPGAVSYPCVVKCNRQSAGKGTEIVHNAEELDDFMTDRRWRPSPKLLQGLIPGQREWVTHAICRPGEVLWYASYEYELPAEEMVRRPDQGGWITCRETPPEVLAFMRKLSADLGYEGPLNMDFKLLNGRLYVFEVNPRFGGSLMLPQHVMVLAEALRCLIAQSVARYRLFG